MFKNREKNLQRICVGCLIKHPVHTSLLDDNRAVEPPDPIPNSEVKRSIADGSVGLPHVRVGHRQASKYKNPNRIAGWGFFLPVEKWFAMAIQLGF